MSYSHELNAYPTSSPYNQGTSYDNDGGYSPHNTGGAPYDDSDDDNSFYTQLQSLRETLSGLESTTFPQLTSLSIQLVNTPDSTLASGISSQLRALETQTLASLSRVSSSLQQLRQSPSLTQNRASALQSLFTKYQSVSRAYQRIQQDAEGRTYTQLARQYRTAVPGASDAEVDAAISSGRAETIFSVHTLQAQSVLAANRDRAGEVRRLAEQMGVLAEMFKGLNEQVMQQGEVVADVEQQVQAANTDIGKGVDETAKAVNHARRARRLKWIMFIVVLIIIALAVGIGVGVTQANKN